MSRCPCRGGVLCRLKENFCHFLGEGTYFKIDVKSLIPNLHKRHPLAASRLKKKKKNTLAKCRSWLVLHAPVNVILTRKFSPAPKAWLCVLAKTHDLIYSIRFISSKICFFLLKEIHQKKCHKEKAWPCHKGTSNCCLLSSLLHENPNCSTVSLEQAVWRLPGDSGFKYVFC